LVFGEHFVLSTWQLAPGQEAFSIDFAEQRRQHSSERHQIVGQGPIISLGQEPKSRASRKWSSSSLAETDAICKNRWNSLLLRLPHPSAMFAPIEADHRRTGL
jgi:hypothetical protein